MYHHSSAPVSSSPHASYQQSPSHSGQQISSQHHSSSSGGTTYSAQNGGSYHAYQQRNGTGHRSSLQQQQPQQTSQQQQDTSPSLSGSYDDSTPPAPNGSPWGYNGTSSHGMYGASGYHGNSGGGGGAPAAYSAYSVQSHQPPPPGHMYGSSSHNGQINGTTGPGGGGSGGASSAHHSGASTPTGGAYPPAHHYGGMGGAGGAYMSQAYGQHPTSQQQQLPQQAQQPMHQHQHQQPSPQSYYPGGHSAASNGMMPSPSYTSAPQYSTQLPLAGRHRVTTTLWEDEGTLCFQVDARGVCVARRHDNNMINGTKLLNVCGMSRGKRDGILKNEKERVVVKVGAMHLKGVWITFARGKQLAEQNGISEILYPLFETNIQSFLYHPDNYPRTAAVMAAAQERHAQRSRASAGGAPHLSPTYPSQRSSSQTGSIGGAQQNPPPLMRSNTTPSSQMPGSPYGHHPNGYGQPSSQSPGSGGHLQSAAGMGHPAHASQAHLPRRTPSSGLKRSFDDHHEDGNSSQFAQVAAPFEDERASSMYANGGGAAKRVRDGANGEELGPLTLSGGNMRSPGSWTPVSTPSLTTSGTLSSMGSSNDEVHAAAVLADGARLGGAASGNLDHYRISSAGDSKAQQTHSSPAAPYGAYKLG